MMSSPSAQPALGRHSGVAPGLAELDHAHVWHPFTDMHRWRQQQPLVIERAEGFDLIDTHGDRYLDGVSSLWCNVHGHRHPHLDQAIRDQLDKAAHTTLLGLASPPSIELAARLVGIVNDRLGIGDASPRRLERVFYTDAGATAVEVAIKMAVGYWRHNGKPDKHRLIVLGGAYHGDTVGAMSAGYSELFHKPYERLVFEVDRLTPPDPVRAGDAAQEPCPAAGCPACSDVPQPPQPVDPSPGAADRVWPSECPRKAHAILEHARQELEHLLQAKGDAVAAVLIEPVMQGAAGMVAQPPGYLAMVRELCDQHEALLIADEVATGFGRTGKLFACEHEQVAPDILCLAKGLTGGYLPVAATVCTAAIEDAFSDPNGDNRLYHGHTYTGNALGCAVALASLDLWEAGKSTPASEHALSADLSAWSPPDLLAHIEASAELIASKLDALRDPRNTPRVLDVRQRGLMVGIELSPDPGSDGNAGLPAAPQSPAQAVCLALLNQGLWLRPLGDVVILMPAPAMDHANLARLCDAVVQEIQSLPG